MQLQVIPGFTLFANKRRVCNISLLVKMLHTLFILLYLLADIIYC